MVYNGLLTRLIESERRQRFGWFADLHTLPAAVVHLSERRQRFGWFTELHMLAATAAWLVKSERRQRSGL